MSEFTNLQKITCWYLLFLLTSVVNLNGQLVNGLTTYWSFDQTLEDNAGDLIGSANTTDDTLTFQGSGSGYGAGLFGNGGYSGNGNGYAEVADAADIDEFNNVISISLWVKVDDFDRRWQTIISKGEDNNYRLARYRETNFLSYVGVDSDMSSGPVGINDGSWHHVVVTSGPAGDRLYIDGNLATVNTTVGTLDNSNNPLRIGSNPEMSNREWDGEIDDVALWHRQLNAAEVTSIYNAGINAQSLADLIVSSMNPDLDNDGLLDVWEAQHGLDFSPETGALGDNGAAGDPDGDSLSNINEQTVGTNPVVADTDGDGLWDGAEVVTHGTDPTIADSDEDGSIDGEEIFFGTGPNDDQSIPDFGETVSGINTTGTIGPYLDGALPSLNPSMSIDSTWATERVFDNLSFASLKGVVSEPLSTYIHVIERRGTIQRVDASDRNTTEQQQVLNISSDVVFGDNGGLRSVVFHPEYNQAGSPNRNYMYCFYSTTASTSRGFTSNDESFFYRLSRFTRNESTGNFPASSELVLIQQHSRDEGQHFGGSIAFDQNGFLVIGWGDMEFRQSRVGVDFYQDAQRVDRIFQAAILRIDVDNQGGAISHAPTRTLQGSSGPWGVAGTSQSCPPTHNYYHVDNFSGRDYMIPSDNYFVTNPPAPGDGDSFLDTPAHGDALEEYIALGTRNPWRMAVDPVDGHIAFFNVGSNQDDDFEEVDLLTPGANFGWPYLEGTTSQTSETGRSMPPAQYGPIYLGTETPPLAFWDHDSGRVSSGGLFYHGNQWQNLRNQLIFADQNSGRIWALDYKSSGAPSGTFIESDGVSIHNNHTVELLLDSSLGIRQMAASSSGEEIYIAGSNNIYRLFDSASPNPQPPALLSQTGAFTDLVNLTPRAGLIPYEPASELWSDRAEKFRWIAIPNNLGTAGEYDEASQKITYSENGEWAYPIGTVFVKHFALPSDLRDPANPTNLIPVETRFLVRGETGVYFYFTYRWRADESDADLLLSGETKDLSIINEQGVTINQTWTYPTRANCVECHQGNSGSVLGMKSRQLNHFINYPSSNLSANQLTTFSQLGIFDQGPDFGNLGTALRSVAIDDTTESLELRVRSYLDSNCSYCHRPGSESGRAGFDALLTTPLSLAEMINAPHEAGDLGVADAQIVRPGAPEQSILYLRDSTTEEEDRMPPIGRSLNDEQYLPVLRAWIETHGLTEFINWANVLGIQGGLTGDDDGDGYSNVFEFVFRQNGVAIDVSNLPGVVPVQNSTPTISIPVSGAALTDGFTVRVEGSADLVNWYALGEPESDLELVSDSSAPGTDGVVVVRIVSDSAQYFLRYGVVLP